jgi:hypothetical protein
MSGKLIKNSAKKLKSSAMEATSINDSTVSATYGSTQTPFLEYFFVRIHFQFPIGNMGRKTTRVSTLVGRKRSYIADASARRPPLLKKRTNVTFGMI